MTHVKRNIVDSNLHLLGIGGTKAEGHPRIGFNPRKLRSIEIVR